MSTSKRKNQAAIPIVDLTSENMGSCPPASSKTLEDLPPELLTNILEFAAIAKDRKTMLRYRLVNSKWKELLNSLIEKKIASGELKTFPAMKVEGVGQEYHRNHLRISPTRYSAGKNLFPFNSLHLSGTVNSNYVRCRGYIPMALPIFASKFCGNLTTFSFHEQEIPLQTLGTMLASMPNLKRLILLDVKQVATIIVPDGKVLSQPPPLPNLTSLELKSNPAEDVYERAKTRCLYLWLLVPYADKLVSLNLDTFDLFPSLHQRRQYVHTYGPGKRVSIGTTSDSAFEKLTELTISRPSKEFLLRSNTPALQTLYVIDRREWTTTDLSNLTGFLVYCKRLKKLSLDVKLNKLVEFEPNLAVDPNIRLKTPLSYRSKSRNDLD